MSPSQIEIGLLLHTRHLIRDGGSGSHLIASLAGANALVVVPEKTTELEAGATVSVMLLERRQA